MKRSALVFIVVVASGCEPSKPATTAAPMAPATETTPTPAASTPVATTVRPAPVASASASVAKMACTPLAWDKDRTSAKPTTLTGTIGNGEGTNGTGATEKFQTLVLEKPACGPDEAPVAELQLYTNDKSIELAKVVGKKVTIDGELFAAQTAHHHRPIVVQVKKLTAN